MNGCIGIDIGGTKIEIVVLDCQTGKELYRNRISTPLNYEDFLGKTETLIREAEQSTGLKCTIGIGIPGIVFNDGSLRNYNNLPFIKPDFGKDISKLLARPIKVGNDANCFALSESTDGAAQGYTTAFCAIFGTGVGAGIVVNGKVINGPHGMAGEWGHGSQPYATIDEIITPCRCGGKGHIEALLSAPAVLEQYNLIATPEEKVSGVKQIVEKTAEMNQQATTVLSRFYERMARAFLNIAGILDPDVIVLGGGLSNIDAIYEEVPERFRRLAKDLNGADVKLNLKKNRYGDSSGIRGAAWLGAEQLL